MTLSAATVKRDFYTLVSAGAAFATVRASCRVIPAADLTKTLPAAPFLAVGYGPLTGIAQDVRTLFPTLWLYDDAAQGWYRLNTIAALIEAALDAEGLLPGCEIALAGTDRETTDGALKRPVLPIRLTIKGRF